MIAEYGAAGVTLLVAFAGVFGLVIGSFLNVVVWRVPRGESIVRPPSACPRCGHPIRWYDNIPVVSWLVLRARCRDCDEPISARYPLVEAGTGLGFAVLAWAGLADAAPIAALPLLLVFAAYSIALALIDLDHRLLPDRIVLPAYVVFAALVVLASAITGDWWAALRALVAGAVLFAFFLIVALVYPAGMGGGDIKLAGLLGLVLGWFGWRQVVVGAFAGFLIGAVVGIITMIARRSGRKTAIPFGPSLLAGAWVGVFAGAALGDWYLHITGLA